MGSFTNYTDSIKNLLEEIIEDIRWIEGELLNNTSHWTEENIKELYKLFEKIKYFEPRENKKEEGFDLYIYDGDDFIRLSSLDIIELATIYTDIIIIEKAISREMAMELDKILQFIEKIN